MISQTITKSSIVKECRIKKKKKKSNAILKSSRTMRTYVFRVSVASYHLWVISTSASVVDVPANPPNCLGSTFDTMVSPTHSMTIDSNTFAAIGVSDIGRMSL